MVANDLTELEVQSEGERVALKRRGVDASAPLIVAHPAAPVPTASAPPPSPPATDDGGVTIPSPMVGTFYAAPSPDANSFVAVGDTVNADSVVCIIEAMKVFNEIKAEVAGVILKVLVDNGHAVEFDQPLFLVKPA